MNEERDCILLNLKDAGCDQLTITKCMEDLEKGEKDSLLKVLACHRDRLLQSLHKCQEQIDCLDYLIHQIRNK